MGGSAGAPNNPPPPPRGGVLKQSPPPPLFCCTVAAGPPQPLRMPLFPCDHGPEYRPFWHGLHFRARPEEERFQARYARSTVHCCVVWALTHLAFAALLPLSDAGAGLPLRYYLSWGPAAAVALAALLAVTCTAAGRAHAAVVLSLAAVLMTLASSWLVHVHTDVLVTRAPETSLALVAEAVRGRPDAERQLQAHLQFTVSSVNLNGQLFFSVMQVRRAGAGRGGGGAGGRARERLRRGAVLESPDFFFFVKDTPRGQPTAHRRQPPPTARQLLTAHRHPPPTTANRQPPTANRQPPPTTIRQPPTVDQYCFCGLVSCPCLAHEAKSGPVNVHFCCRHEPFSFVFSPEGQPRLLAVGERLRSPSRRL